MTFFNHHSGKHLALVLASLAAVGVIGSVGAGVHADIVSGFSGSSNWTLVAANSAVTAGVPGIGLIAPGDLTLTSTSNSEIAGAWYNTPQDVGASWTATFTWQWSGTTSPADGFMFVLQNAGTDALGWGGGNKGYAGPLTGDTHPSTSATVNGIATATIPVTPSFGVGVENYSSANSHNLTIGTGGAIVQSGNISGSSLDTQTDTNPINFTISYYQPDNVVSVSAVDSTNSSESLSYNYQLPTKYGMNPTVSPLPLSSIVGGNTAYVGFTGATGGVNEEQDFTNFNFTAGASAPTGYTPPPPAPAFVSVARAPIALTAGSFNADVVVENSASLPAGATVSSSIATPAGVTNNALYEAGLTVAGSAVQGGLPTSHDFLSNGDGVSTFQLQHYTNTNNVLRLTSAVTSGTMTLANPTAFSTLAILAMGAGAAHDSVGAVTLNFASGKSVTTDYAALDWFSGNIDSTTPDGNPYGLALSGLGRIAITKTISSSSVSGLPSYPGLYETVLNISHLGIDSSGDFVDASGYGALDSLTFNLASSVSTGSAAKVTEIFAVSGSAVPEPASLALLGLGATACLLLVGRRRQKI